MMLAVSILGAPTPQDAALEPSTASKAAIKAVSISGAAALVPQPPLDAGETHVAQAPAQLWTNETTVPSCCDSDEEAIEDAAVFDEALAGVHGMLLSKYLEYLGTEHAISTDAETLALYQGMGSSLTSVNAGTGVTSGAAGYLGTTSDGRLMLGFAGTDFADVNDVVADVSSAATATRSFGGKDYEIGAGFVWQCARPAPSASARAQHA